MEPPNKHFKHDHNQERIAALGDKYGVKIKQLKSQSNASKTHMQRIGMDLAALESQVTALERCVMDD